MTVDLSQFEQIWIADFEYRQPDGHLPEPHCMVAREYRSGLTLRPWADELAGMVSPPFSVGADSLFIAYYASAELNCFRVLGWPMPVNILDLYVEFRNRTNGLPVPCGRGLVGALAYYGLDSIAASEKDSMRDMAIRGGPFSDDEQSALIDYCESDVVACARLLPAMLPDIDLPRALLRGRYMAAVSAMETNGTPIDVDTFDRLRDNWQRLQSKLIEAVDADYGVYVPTGRKLDPDTRLGAATLDTATECGIDPHHLADAVDTVAAEHRENRNEREEALKVARRATGLDAGRIAKWENSGTDHSVWPGFDVKARELASQYPALGIGRGYETETGYDDTDYAGQLWALLRDGVSPVKPKHDPEILQQAADRVIAAGGSVGDGRLSFSAKRFAEYLARKGIPWVRLESGALDLKAETFRQAARQNIELAPLRELRHSLSELRLNSLAVGPDGRNRCMLSVFQSRTGRNQPSNSKFIFGPSCWLRGLIQPEQGRALAYIDWAQQEFAIAAALSGDRHMMDAYTSADPYLTFAKQAGSVPPDATKDSHPNERGQFKICALAVQYGMGAASLAQSLGVPEAKGRELLRLHRETYPKFWKWSGAAVDHAMIRSWLQTTFGWKIRVGPDSNPRSLANFPMQANGAEMLRLACCLITERGIRVCAPVHDAVLVEAEIEEIETVVADTQAAMAEASRIVLDGFELRTDAEIVRWPDRYMDPRGQKMWDTIMGILDELEDHPEWCSADAHQHVAQTHTSCCAGATPGPSNKISPPF